MAEAEPGARGGGGAREWVRKAMAVVGLGAPAPAAPTPSSDLSTRLAQERTRLARERTAYAAERTLMAWVRTSMAMISFGFTLVKLNEYFEKGQQLTFGILGHSYGPLGLGLAFISLGTLALIPAVLQQRRTLEMLHRQGLEPRWSLALIMASIMALLGLFAFGSLVLKL